jgi:hypothetical protein
MKDNNKDNGVNGRHGNWGDDWGDGERRAMKVPVLSGTSLSMKLSMTRRD